MSTIKLKNIKQSVVESVTQPLSIGGVLSDGSDEVLNIASNGDLQFKKIIQTNGIKFPATQVPSSDPNTLDDYEEGSFTATFWSGRDKTGTSFTSPACKYVKIGSIVHAMIFRSNFGTGLSVQSVTLPFTVDVGWLSTGITESGVFVANPDGNVDYVNFALAISNVWERFSLTFKVL